MTDPDGALDAEAEDIVQTLDVETEAWEDELDVKGTFEVRALHVAVYVPDKDLIVVHGGVEKCTLIEASEAPFQRRVIDRGISGDHGRIDDGGARLDHTVDECDQVLDDTVFLRFDAQGDATWVAGPPGPQLMMHTAAYDPPSQRMLVYGGSSDGKRTSDEVWALDLSGVSGDDVSKATWNEVQTEGSGPGGRAQHGMALDAANRRLIFYGGSKSSPLADGEVAAQNETYALDVTQSPAVWSSLNTGVDTRITPVLACDDYHRVVLMYGGRRRWNDTSHLISRDLHVLTAAAVPTGQPTPIPTTPGGTPATPRPTAEPPTPAPTRPRGSATRRAEWYPRRC